MIASEPLKVSSTYAAMEPDARAAWKTDQMAREGHGSFSPPGTPEREENFNRWNNRSKVRDGEGNPLRLYHATPKSFDTFLPGGTQHESEMPSGPATWLSPYPDKQPAGHHVGGYQGNFKSGANVMPVHADIRNPLVIDSKTMRDWARQSYANGSGEFPLLISPETRKMLLEDGYDGIFWAGFDATSKDEAFYGDHGIGEHPSKDEEIIALHPPGRAQIKSAIGNRGQYDPEDLHVNHAHGGSAENKDVRRALMIARKPRQDGGSYRASDVRPGGWGASLENTHTKPTLMGMRPDQLTKIARGMPGYAHLQQAAQDFMADNPQAPVSETVHDILQRQDMGYAYSNGGRTKEERRALMIARDQRALLRRVANIYPGPAGGMDPSPGGGGYSGPGGGKYIGPSHYADGGSVPPFKLYSGAAKVIAAKGQAKATPQQYAAMPGIKPDELKYSNFDTLGSKALPREEVIKHLEANRLPIEETQLGGKGRNTSTQFHGPETTLPGGKNYREVLMHLAPMTKQRFGLVDENDDVVGRHDTYEAAANAAYLSQGQHSVALLNPDGSVNANEDPEGFKSDLYNSRHWDQPNVLAHVRMSDRKGPNGEKVLHVEEVQSDWGQQGRDQGFGLSPEEHAEIEALQKKARGIGGIIKLSQEDRTRWEELGKKVENTRSVPRGPYVDNTQKWTDLALKRVLHEAAHGGYDKIVFTPGDEQNKRYSLEHHVKNIQYYPDTKYLGATTHDNRGVEHEGVEPDDLSKHIGKEAADRILKQPLQRFEGRGKLGGEFYHELEGEGLKVGGEGMRGYYDNILPKRLQALAQQHDPQAKVRLGAYPLKDFYVKHSPGYQGNDFEAFTPTDASLGAHPTREAAEAAIAQRRATPGDETAPLHSLDVTPQMRDSIKANGFNSFKRGGEVDDDPIKDWQWRPTEDVRNELQLDEIPSHVHKFGAFMDETARRAATQGLTPRDLIKAYAITRSSIGRGALPVSTVRRPKNPEYGFDALPKGLQGSLRPEGAMGHWLHTKMGQRYLDEAEAGRVDEEAVRDAIKSMGAFGLPDKAEGKALRWAPKNLPGQEGRVSELIARAHRGQSSPEEWRGEMRVPGIAESKAGFFAAMLGRGDQPTLDARQIILNTGQSTKKAAPYLSPKGAKEAAVNRLADRQTELGLKHDKSMSPFYQHLTHHAIWDKTGGEETTHDDLMQALRGAKDGGRQGYKEGGAPPIIGHPLAHGLLEAFPEGFKDVPEAHLRQMLRNPFTDATATHNLLYRASQLTGHPTQKLMQHLMPSGPREPGRQGITSLRQPDLIERAMATIAPNRRIAVAKPRPMTPEDLFKMRAVSVAGMSDRSAAGFDVTGADKVDFGENISALGGNDYSLMPRSIKNKLAWAGARAPITGLGNAAKEKLQDVKKNYGVDAQPLLTTKLMGLQSLDQTHMVMRAASHLLRNAPIADADAEAFNAFVRNQRPSAKQGKIQPPYMPDFPGIKHEKLYDYLMQQKMPNRTALIKAMDIGAWNKKGIPNPAAIRMAFTKPELMSAPEGTPGAMFATMDPGDPHHTVKSGHGSYPVGVKGENVGGLDRIVPKEDFHQTYFDQPKIKAKAAAGNNSQVMSGYMKSPVTQYHDQEWLDRIMPIYEKAPPFRKAGGRAGYAPSGSVSRALDIARKINGR